MKRRGNDRSGSSRTVGRRDRPGDKKGKGGKDGANPLRTAFTEDLVEEVVYPLIVAEQLCVRAQPSAEVEEGLPLLVTFSSESFE